MFYTLFKNNKINDVKEKKKNKKKKKKSIFYTQVAKFTRVDRI